MRPGCSSVGAVPWLAGISPPLARRLFYIDLIFGVSIHKIVFMAVQRLSYLDKRRTVLELPALPVIANGALTFKVSLLFPAEFLRLRFVAAWSGVLVGCTASTRRDDPATRDLAPSVEASPRGSERADSPG